MEGVAEHHGHRQDGGDGVGLVLAGDVRSGAVDGLIQAGGGVPDRGGGQQADGAGDHGGLVGEDVPEHVLGDHHVELAGVPDELHGAVVHQHVLIGHVGVFLRQPVHHLPPQAAGLQHVGLVHAGHLVPAQAGQLKGPAADALDLLL